MAAHWWIIRIWVKNFIIQFFKFYEALTFWGITDWGETVPPRVGWIPRDNN
jgi:hypothetical protein